MKRMSDLGEAGFLRELESRFPGTGSVIKGIGDDAAVTSSLPPESEWVFTSDAILEGVHYDDHLGPEGVGRKLLARNLSDLAAMGATPAFCLVNVVVPGETSSDWLLSVYTGLSRLAAEYHCPVIGGDTSQGPGPQFHLFAIGSLPAGTAILRSTAQAGDLVYVSGRLGASLPSGKHASFTPRLKEAKWLREQRLATAMMDISDGLSADLPKLARASHCGFTVHADNIPVHPWLASLPPEEQLRHALEDGEDYELVFTLSAGDRSRLEEGWAGQFDTELHCIGRMEPGNDLVLAHHNGMRQAWEDKGYEHFRSSAG
jgi:thiamine-monophosphate kinase